MAPIDSNLCGTWTLVSYKISSREGDRLLAGDQLRGQLIYSPDGYVAVVITHQPSVADKDTEVIAYSGHFSCSGNLVEHQIFVSNLPHFVDSKQSRVFSIANNSLTLTTADRPNDTHVAIWHRAIPKSIEP